VGAGPVRFETQFTLIRRLHFANLALAISGRHEAPVRSSRIIFHVLFSTCLVPCGESVGKCIWRLPPIWVQWSLMITCQAGQSCHNSLLLVLSSNKRPSVSWLHSLIEISILRASAVLLGYSEPRELGSFCFAFAARAELSDFEWLHRILRSLAT
jgi:hypothetical protein